MRAYKDFVTRDKRCKGANKSAIERKIHKIVFFLKTLSSG